MLKTDYLAIKNQLSFEKPIGVTVAIIGVDVLIVWAAILFLNMDTTPAYLVSQLLLALFFFHNFALLHEAGHGNIHSRRWVNNVVGHYASVFAFLPFFPWKFIHQEHHVWTGNIDRDPTLANLKIVRGKNKIPRISEFAWRTWLPVSASAQQAVFWLYPLVMHKKGKLSGKNLHMTIFSVAFPIAVYMALYALFPATFNLGNLWLAYLLYMVLSELINFPHHIEMPTFSESAPKNKLQAWEQHITTRSCDYGWLSEALALNFNYHTEHHYFPSLPWYRLRGLRRHIKSGLGEHYTELRGIGWNIENRKRTLADVVLHEVTHPSFQPNP